jgi:hypothetical protein
MGDVDLVAGESAVFPVCPVSGAESAQLGGLLNGEAAGVMAGEDEPRGEGVGRDRWFWGRWLVKFPRIRGCHAHILW